MNKPNWLNRLKSGLSKSTTKLTDGIAGILTKRKLDDDALEELEEVLITADLGPATAAKLTASLAACSAAMRPPVDCITLNTDGDTAAIKRSR